MAEHLQGLLNKIQEEGLKKAEAEKQTILDQAKAQAKSIVDQAKAEADQLRSRAESDAAGLQSRAESAVRQAARDVILALESELKRRLETILEQQAAAAITPDFMTRLLDAVVAAYKSDPANLSVEDLTILANPALLDELRNRAVASLAQNFRMKAELFGDRGIKGGLKIGFANSDMYFDCTDGAIAELLAGYLSPKLAALLTGSAE